MLQLNSVFSIEGKHLIFFPHISLETIQINHYPSIYPLHMGFKVYLHRPPPWTRVVSKLADANFDVTM